MKVAVVLSCCGAVCTNGVGRERRPEEDLNINKKQPCCVFISYWMQDRSLSQGEYTIRLCTDQSGDEVPTREEGRQRIRTTHNAHCRVTLNNHGGLPSSTRQGRPLIPVQNAKKVSSHVLV
ncbi:unnamed protein product [Ectocarpus sp. 13 AM-2016]